MILKEIKGNSLAIQWLELGTFTAVAWLQYLVRELRSCKPRIVAKKKKKERKEIKTFLWAPKSKSTMGSELCAHCA